MAQFLNLDEILEYELFKGKNNYLKYEKVA